MNKDITVRFRVDNAFMKRMNEKYRRSNIKTYSEFLRQCVEKTVVKEQPNYKHLQKLIFEMNKIGVLTNQIAKHLNTECKVDLMVLNELKKINTNISLLFESMYDSQNI